MPPARDEMLRAMHARDASCGGRFWTGVTTAGLYCNPSCPARKPLARSVRFFGTREGAWVAGFASTSGFYAAFRRLKGMTPARWPRGEVGRRA